MRSFMMGILLRSDKEQHLPNVIMLTALVLVFFAGSVLAQTSSSVDLVHDSGPLKRQVDNNLCDVNFWYFMSTLNERLGRIDEAKKCLQKVVLIDPHNTEASSYLELFRDLESFKQQARDKPQDANIWFNFAFINERLGLANDAEDCLQKVVFISPRDAEAWLLLGKVQRSLGDFFGARESLNRAIEEAPRSAEAWYMLGISEVDLGSFDKAIEALKHAVEYNSSDKADIPPYVGMYIGALELANGNRELAERERQKLQGLMPEYANSLNVLIKLSQ
ncbi:MAG: tetratricopeptide repeat protein [Candidatus Riflebacteria bacterium]|nr:tetratricopeptide repeat protein [Candidatus Riflebacteria bacterium]